MSDLPKPTTGEWTPRYVQSICEKVYSDDLTPEQAKAIADAHNAALAAERENLILAQQMVKIESRRANDSIEENVRLMNELAVERERAGKAESNYARAAEEQKELIECYAKIGEIAGVSGDSTWPSGTVEAVKQLRSQRDEAIRLLECKKNELAAAQSTTAEVEDHNIRGAIHPDVLAKHIAEAQKPLVDALNRRVYAKV